MNASRALLLASSLWLVSGCSSEAAPSTADAATSADSTPSDSATTDSGATTDTTTPTTDSAMSTDSAPSDAPAACTPIANLGAVVSKTTVAGAPPAMKGGTILAGTYVLTKFELYAGGTGTSTHKETMEFGAGVLTATASTNGGEEKPSFFTFATSGDTLTLTQTCGKMGSLPLKYTATATEFVLVAPTNPNQIQTYTKR